jgi:hypothetical protein
MSEAEKNAAIAERAKAKEAAQQNNNNQRGGIGGIMPQIRVGGFRRRRNQGSSGANNDAPEIRSLWFMNDAGVLETMLVEIGISDGSVTEIITEENLEGKSVINRERIL